MNVALSLSSGGARGMAHIGAIEAILDSGHTITSIAGTSMGSVIGGIYASGHLKEYKEWMIKLDKRKVFGLMDFTLSRDGFLKGKRIINELKSFIPDEKIEDLPIPFVAIATEISRGKEVIFDRGSLYTAIRSSISIPSLLIPIKSNGKILVDGGVLNPLPLNRTQRTPNDVLIGIDVAASSKLEDYSPDKKHILNPSINGEELVEKSEKKLNLNDSNNEIDFSMATKFIQRIFPYFSISEKDPDSYSFYSLALKSNSLMIQKITDLSIELYKPDLVVRIPNNICHVMEFYRAKEMIELGYNYTKKALEEYSTLH